MDSDHATVDRRRTAQFTWGAGDIVLLNEDDTEEGQDPKEQ